MTESWEIDPTNTDGDRDGAGAEGSAVGGDSAGDTTLPPQLQPPEDIDRTNPFNPIAVLQHNIHQILSMNKLKWLTWISVTTKIGTLMIFLCSQNLRVRKKNKQLLPKPFGSLKINFQMLM